MSTITVEAHVSDSVQVDVAIKDIIDGASESDLQALVEAAEVKGITVINNFNVIERAYLDALKIQDILPRSIRDLFWVVHGRAMA